MVFKKIIISSFLIFMTLNISYGEEQMPKEQDYDLKIINEKLIENSDQKDEFKILEHTRTKTFKNNQRTEFISPLL